MLHFCLIMCDAILWVSFDVSALEYCGLSLVLSLVLRSMLLKRTIGDLNGTLEVPDENEKGKTTKDVCAKMRFASGNRGSEERYDELG